MDVDESIYEYQICCMFYAVYKILLIWENFAEWLSLIEHFPRNVHHTKSYFLPNSEMNFMDWCVYYVCLCMDTQLQKLLMFYQSGVWLNVW